MEKIQEVTNKISTTLFIKPKDSLETTGDEKINKILKNWKKEIIDDCISIIKQCKYCSMETIEEILLKLNES